MSHDELLRRKILSKGLCKEDMDSLVIIVVVVLVVWFVVSSRQESYGYTEDQLLKYTSVLGAPPTYVKAVFSPRSAYVLPQDQQTIRGSPWDTVSKALRNPTVMFNNNTALEWRKNKMDTCSAYNTPIAPRSQQDCPDSSFAFMTDMSRFIPGAKYAGCMQTGASSDPWCYSKPNGTYVPWWERIATNSP